MSCKFLLPALNLTATRIVFSITPATPRFLALGLALMLAPTLIFIRPSLFERTVALWKFHLPAAVIACVGLYIVRSDLPAGGIPALNLPYAVLLYVSFGCLVMAWIQWLVVFALQAWGLVQFICAFASAPPGPAKKKES
jgi:hypothetical protein